MPPERRRSEGDVAKWSNSRRLARRVSGANHPERSGGPKRGVCFLLLTFLCTGRRSASKEK
ncbi:hypothetical protein FEZ61_19890 [Pseudomonas sp. MS15a(2019)]|nr:hypothetical protein [Pseudomonas sp. MS15a(2019)]